MVTKEEIRKNLLKIRDKLPFDEWNEWSLEIAGKVLRSQLYKECDFLLLYSDFRGEVGTKMIIEDALLQGKKIYLPKVLEGFNEAKMDFYNIYDTVELLDGYKGIKEPTGNIEKCFDYSKTSNKKVLMLVPGIAFDINYHRVGYGKGYYDNYLKDKPNILKVGLCFSMQVLDELPFEEKDIKLDYIINENTKLNELNNVKYRKK